MQLLSRPIITVSSCCTKPAKGGRQQSHLTEHQCAIAVDQQVDTLHHVQEHLVLFVPAVTFSNQVCQTMTVTVCHYCCCFKGAKPFLDACSA